jgi:hypothetical protein
MSGNRFEFHLGQHAFCYLAGVPGLETVPEAIF